MFPYHICIFLHLVLGVGEKSQIIGKSRSSNCFQSVHRIPFCFCSVAVFITQSMAGRNRKVRVSSLVLHRFSLQRQP
ncbi:hypothetical protein DPMN_071909 [Dreissena polymorpha]|uniref:Secreted protein n=1 Tax=Dreissena polymorpha TaxID=45954 RepID=A0A9D3Z5E2_DREPO|nr:hypothetical protein DPMN_071909 [Dreissena polymorpha]